MFELLRSFGLDPESQLQKYVFQLWLRSHRLTLVPHTVFVCLCFCELSLICRLQWVCASYLWNLIGSFFDVVKLKPLDIPLQSSRSHLTSYNWIPKVPALSVKFYSEEILKRETACVCFFSRPVSLSSKTLPSKIVLQSRDPQHGLSSYRERGRAWRSFHCGNVLSPVLHWSALPALRLRALFSFKTSAVPGTSPGKWCVANTMA